MVHRGLALSVATVLVVSTAVFGASAFTSATIKRDTDIAVTTDANGIISLTADADSEIVSKSNGELSISFATSNAAGVNTNATYTVGKASTSKVDTKHAFTITNNGHEATDLTVSYDGFATDSGDNLKFVIYSNTDTADTAPEKVDTVAESDKSVTLTTADVGQPYYVVVKVNTGLSNMNDLDPGSSADDLSGTLTITA